MGKPKESVERPVAAADRTLVILDAFAQAQRPLSLGELAEATGLFKSVLLRYILSFEKRTFVVKRADGRYQIGTKALMLSRAFENSLERREMIEASMRRLVAETGESVFYYVREGDTRMCVIGMDSPHPLRVAPRVGMAVAMDATSISAVLRDFQAGGRGIGAYDAAVVRATVGEYDALTSSISVPVFDAADTLAGALCVSGPQLRFDSHAKTAQSIVLGEGWRLCQALGFVGDGGGPAPMAPDRPVPISGGGRDA